MAQTYAENAYDNIAFVAAEPGYLELPIHVRHAGWSVFRKGSKYEVPNCPDCIIGINLYGALRVVVDKKSYRLESPGDVLILRPGSHYFYECESEFHADRVVNINGPLITQFLQTSGLGSMVIVQPRSAATVCELLLRIYRYCAANRLDANLQASAAAYELLLHLALSVQRHLPSAVSEAMAFIHSRIHDRLTNTDISRAAGLSRSRLCGMFSATLGVSPLAYHRARRLEIAKSMLTGTSKSVKEIAAYLGYEDQLVFSRDFKKAKGFSPKYFRLKSERASRD